MQPIALAKINVPSASMIASRPRTSMSDESLNGIELSTFSSSPSSQNLEKICPISQEPIPIDKQYVAADGQVYHRDELKKIGS